MKRITKVAIAAVAVVAAGGAIAATAQADGRWDRGEGYHRGGYHHEGRHDGRMRGDFRHGGGPMLKLFESFDTNGDGVLTQDEIDGARAARFAKFDTNGDKQLSLDEYQALWLDAMHERMVRAFQRLDTDGDAKVTVAEFEAPFAELVARADRNDDGKLDKSDRREPRMYEHGPRMGDDHGPRMGDGHGPRMHGDDDR